MAALLRQAARRLGGSVIQRRLAHTAGEAIQEALHQHMIKEELYAALLKAKPEEMSFITYCRNRRLLQHLSAHVTPIPCDAQWRSLRLSRVAHNLVKVATTISCGYMIAIGFVAVEDLLAPSEKKQEH